MDDKYKTILLIASSHQAFGLVIQCPRVNWMSVLDLGRGVNWLSDKEAQISEYIWNLKSIRLSPGNWSA